MPAQAWNETNDEFATQPGRKPWIAEMYGYSFGAARAGVWHRVDHSAMLYPGHTPLGGPSPGPCGGRGGGTGGREEKGGRGERA